MNILKTVAPYLIGLTVLLFFAAIILCQRSGDFLERGIESEREGDLVEAIEMYEWAIQNYTPVFHHTDSAIARLKSIAAESETNDATNTAIEAWQGIVSGLAVIRHVGQPYAKEKEHAHQELERLRNRVIEKRNANRN